MNDPTNEPTIPHPSWCVPAECEFAGVEGYHLGPAAVFHLAGPGSVVARLEQLVDEEPPHDVQVRLEVVEREISARLVAAADAALDAGAVGVDNRAAADLFAADARRLATTLIELAGEADWLNPAGGAR